MRIFSLSGVVLLAAAVWAEEPVADSAAVAPVIDPASVTLTQDPDTRVVTVGYTLTGTNAIVTVDFQTNVVGTATWVSIGGEHVRRVGGEVNKVVTKIETPLAITWHPAREWAGHVVTGSCFRAVVKAWDLHAPPDYMVVDLGGAGPGCRRFYPSAETLPEDLATSDFYRVGALVMRRIPAKDVVWRMSSPSTEANRAAHEAAHYVKLTRDYYLAVFETTEYQAYHLSGDRTYIRGGRRGAPMCNVEEDSSETSYNNIRGTTYSWPGDGHAVDADSLLGKARVLTGIPSLDLPTDAQWEYACRAGMQAPRYFDGTGDALGDHAWYNGNSGGYTHRVGEKKPNPWGLYDMFGNVLEWCLDWRDNFDSAGGAVVVDPMGPASGSARVKHGGCDIQGEGTAFRAAYRDADGPSYHANTDGFRLCCDADVTTFDPAE